MYLSIVYLNNFFWENIVPFQDAIPSPSVHILILCNLQITSILFLYSKLVFLLRMCCWITCSLWELFCTLCKDRSLFTTMCKRHRSCSQWHLCIIYTHFCKHISLIVLYIFIVTFKNVVRVVLDKIKCSYIVASLANELTFKI